VQRCGSCGHEAIAYNSCRNRHCPKCQGSRTAAWLRREASFLLPVDYYHVVFTLPPAVAEVVWQNHRVGYTLLFEAAQQTLREVAADPRQLGARVGLLMVLHTWGQDLHYHPHVHGVATGGGLACDRDGEIEVPPRWVACRPGFFLPVRVLSRLFRGKFLDGLRRAHAAGKLHFYGALSSLAEPSPFASWRGEQYRTDWVVYAKKPFGGPEQVLKYLARYTHRVAISNHRLLSHDGVTVRFAAKDYAEGGRRRVVSLSGEEFLRRWVQHVLPRGFTKVRHYGLLANRDREKRLTLCRVLLALLGLFVSLGKGLNAEPVVPRRGCPQCGSECLSVASRLEPCVDEASLGRPPPTLADTS
jgi:hypothetical protein